MSMIGIDVGTTNLKAVVLSEDGQILFTTAVPTPARCCEGGGIEYEPEELWDAFSYLMSSIGKQVLPDPVRSLAFSSMGEAGLFLDRRGNPLTPIISWADRRTQALVPEVRSRTDPFDLFLRTGLHVSNSHSLIKMLWLLRQDPTLSDRVQTWLFIADYLIYRLTGQIRTDASLASRSLLFNIRQRDWDQELVQVFGLDPRWLPPVQRSGDFVGEIRPPLASAWGLNSPLTVYAGGHDHLCGAVAAGVFSRERLLDSVGTTEELLATLDEPKLDEEMFKCGLSVGCHVVSDCFYLIGGIRFSGGMIDWFRKCHPSYQDNEKWERLQQEVRRIRCGSDGLVVIPYWLGSNSPFRDSRARGAIWGLSPEHTEAHILRAIYEGLAMELKRLLHVVSGILPQGRSEIISIGGGSLNRVWNEIKSTVLGMPLHIFSITNASAVGAALLANGHGASSEVLTLHQRRLVRHLPDPGYVQRPDSTRTPLYQEIYETMFLPLSSTLREYASTNRRTIQDNR